MNIKIEKSTLEGKVLIPPSKSISHRAIISASLCKGQSNLYNIAYSDDVLATISVLESLGTVFKKNRNSLQVINNNSKPKDLIYLNCNESGSTIRFTIPLALSQGGEFIFDGEYSLKNRPLDTYNEVYEKSTISYNYLCDKSLPLHLKGSLQSGNYEIKGNVSSQFITGLIFGLTNTEGKSTITIKSELESKAYIDLTLDVLKDFGVKVINNNYKSFEIEKSTYKQNDYKIEGDYSHVAFFALAGAIGKELRIFGLNPNSKQGDKKVIDIFKQFKVNVETTEDCYIFSKSTPVGTTLDLRETPDLAPVVFALATISQGETIVRGIERLRIKESDRVKSMTTELKKLGANIEVFDDYVKIIGNNNQKLKGGVTLHSWSDHRVVMTLAILSTICEKPVVMEDVNCVNKSFPNFFDVLSTLNCNFSEI